MRMCGVQWKYIRRGMVNEFVEFVFLNKPSSTRKYNESNRSFFFLLFKQFYTFDESVTSAPPFCTWILVTFIYTHDYVERLHTDNAYEHWNRVDLVLLYYVLVHQVNTEHRIQYSYLMNDFAFKLQLNTILTYFIFREWIVSIFFQHEMLQV